MRRSFFDNLKSCEMENEKCVVRVTKAHKCYLVVRALQCKEADGIRRMKVVLTPLVHVLVQI